MSTKTRSINDIVGRRADATATRDQIGFWTLAALGARDYVRDDANGKLTFRISGGRLRKIIVKLAADDTYAVEVGHFDYDLNVFGWVTDALRENVYCDMLSETVREMGDIGIDFGWDDDADEDDDF